MTTPGSRGPRHGPVRLAHPGDRLCSQGFELTPCSGHFLMDAGLEMT